MTAQIHSEFLYREKKYTLAGVSGDELLDISALGLKPVMASTGCYRGYQAIFSVVESRLVLDTLHVRLVARRDLDSHNERATGPVINGVSPSSSRGVHDPFDNHYEGLNYHLAYSGGLLLADGFISSLYDHMGFHPEWKFETVIELVFEAGVLKEAHDRSVQMAEMRKKILTSPEADAPGGKPSSEEHMEFIRRAFDQRYRK